MDLDAISALSEKVSRRLDLEDFGRGRYELEVSSPGIERPLRTPEHFRRSCEVKNPFEGKPEAIKEGEKIFDAKCADCHGGDAMGQSGPDLTDNKWIYGGSDADVFETVTNGRKGGMPSWRSELSKDEIWKAIAYIRSLEKN